MFHPAEAGDLSKGDAAHEGRPTACSNFHAADCGRRSSLNAEAKDL